jgi:hypothetical protein
MWFVLIVRDDLRTMSPDIGSHLVLTQIAIHAAASQSILARVAGDLSPWTFGWAAVASLLTAALAAGTAWLARSTSQDVRARQRPMLWSDGDVLLRVYPTGWLVDVEVPLRNIGGGPALRVSVDAHIVYPNGGGATVPSFTGSIRPGDAAFFRIGLPATAEKLVNVAKIQTGVLVTITYRDIRGMDYKSELDYCDLSRPFIFFDKIPSESVEFQLGITDGRFSELNWIARRRLQLKRWKSRKNVFIPPHRPKNS